MYKLSPPTNREGPLHHLIFSDYIYRDSAGYPETGISGPSPASSGLPFGLLFMGGVLT